MRIWVHGGFANGSGTGTPSYTPEAEAFFTAASITDTTEKNAINQLVVDLQSASVWNKMDIIYPYVGNTSGSTSYNLKDTGSYQITWDLGTSGIDFNNGVNFSGSNNNYGRTGWIPSTTLTTAQDLSIGYGSNTLNNTVVDVEFGCFNNTAQALQVNVDNNANSFATRFTSDASISGTTIATGSMLLLKPSGSNTINFYQSGETVRTTSSTNNSIPTYEFYLGGMNFNGSFYTPNQSSNRHTFFTIGEGLTPTEAADYITAFDTFQTTLSR